MTSPKDVEAVTDALARQGYALSPGRAEAVAQAAAELASTGRSLAAGLPFGADLYGFLAYLAGRRET